VQQQIDRQTNMAQAVIRSTNYTMMHGDHRALQHTLKNMGQVSGVHHLRLFDKQGRITFSQNKGEIGSMIDTQEEACIICHQQGRTLTTLGRAERVRRFEAKNGREVIALTTPIPNKPQCAQKCHAHPPEKKILGILDVGMTTSQLQQELRGVVQGLALFWFLLTLLVLGLICALMQRFVLRPVAELLRYKRSLLAGEKPSPPHFGVEELEELAQGYTQLDGKRHAGQQENGNEHGYPE